MTPEIYHCVADYVGDSLQLAKLAAASDADIIVQAGVHFMAETSKILNPEQARAHPRFRGRLFAGGVDHGRRRARAAQGISGRADRRLCEHFGRVKAEVDICCTSSNALRVVESLGSIA